MSETISLELLGTLLRQIQAEQRSMQGEVSLLHAEIARMTPRETTLEMLHVLTGRISNFEALMEARLDQLSAQVAGLRPEK